MSWLFPEESAIEVDISECEALEVEVAMEGALSKGFSEHIHAKREIKPHRSAMNEAVRQSDFKTAAREAEACGKILRNACNEVKKLEPGLLTNLIVDIAIFTMTEIVYVLLLSKLGARDRQRTATKYNEAEKDIVKKVSEGGGLTVGERAGIMGTNAYSEAEKMAEKLRAKGVQVGQENIDMMAASKATIEKRDAALAKSQKAQTAAIGTASLVNGLNVIYNQIRNIKRAKSGEISSAETNSLLKICVRSLDQAATGYEKKAKEYASIARAFGSAKECWLFPDASNTSAALEAEIFDAEFDAVMEGVTIDSVKVYLATMRKIKPAASAYKAAIKSGHMKEASTAAIQCATALEEAANGLANLEVNVMSTYFFNVILITCRVMLQFVALAAIVGAVETVAHKHELKKFDKQVDKIIADEGSSLRAVSNKYKDQQDASINNYLDKAAKYEKSKKYGGFTEDVNRTRSEYEKAIHELENALKLGNDERHSIMNSTFGSIDNELDKTFDKIKRNAKIGNNITAGFGVISTIDHVASVLKTMRNILEHKRGMDVASGETNKIIGMLVKVMRDQAKNYRVLAAKAKATPATESWLFDVESQEYATESEIVGSMAELEKAQAFVSAWLECHPNTMAPLYGAEADEQLKSFRAEHVQDELREDPDYVDPHEERTCGRLTYLVEVKPDTTNVTIPVFQAGRNTVVEYHSKEIEETLIKYYDAAIQPQDNIVSEAVEGILGALLGTPPKREVPEIVKTYKEAREKNSQKISEVERHFRNDTEEVIGELIARYLKENKMKPLSANAAYEWGMNYMYQVFNRYHLAVQVLTGQAFGFVALYDGTSYTSRDAHVIRAYVPMTDGKVETFDYIDLVLKYYGDPKPAQESVFQDMAKLSLSRSNQTFVPKHVKAKQSDIRKDVNAKTKANIQACPDRKKLFKIAAQAIRPQKGWKTGEEGKKQCEEIAARQNKKGATATVDNYNDLYYVVVKGDGEGYDEWVMYIPQVAGVKTRNIHQAAREIAIVQHDHKVSLPSLESQITFG